MPQKFTTDSELLYEFTLQKIQAGENILEIGCGCGEISILIVEKAKCNIIGIDINLKAIETAKTIYQKIKSKKQFLGEITFENISLQSFSKQKNITEKFDRVLVNPPFYHPQKSRSSPDATRRIARQSDFLPIKDIFKFSSILLKHKGFLDLIFPPENLREIFLLSSKYNLQITEIQPVYTKKNTEAKRILIQCRKGVNTDLKIIFPNLYFEKCL